MGRTKQHSGNLGQGAHPNQTPLAKQQEIQKLAKEGLTLSAIAKQTGISRNTCRRYAGEVGVDFTANRKAGLEEATQIQSLSLKQRRQKLAERMLDEADRLLDQLHQPHLAFSFGGKDNTYEEHELAAPPAADKKHLVGAAGILMQKHLEYIKHDSDNGASEAVSLVSRLVDSLSMPPEVGP